MKRTSIGNSLRTLRERLRPKTTAVAIVGTGLGVAILLQNEDARSLVKAAACPVPHCFEAGEPALAADVNENFEYLAERTVFRKIARVAGYQADGADTGPLATRLLVFDKTQDDTGVRVVWQDNLRAYNNPAANACQWEILFNGVSCADPGPLTYDVYGGALAGQNDHRPKANVGTCFGLSAQSYNIQVTVRTHPGYANADCYTGWSESYFALEAEEVY